MLFLNGERVNQAHWRAMNVGDILLMTGALKSRGAILLDAKRLSGGRQFYSAMRPEGLYVWRPSPYDPYKGVPPRARAVDEPNPVAQRRREREAWHDANPNPVPTIVRKNRPRVMQPATERRSLLMCASLYGRTYGRRYKVKRIEDDTLTCTRLPDPIIDPFS